MTWLYQYGIKLKYKFRRRHIGGSGRRWTEYVRAIARGECLWHQKRLSARQVRRLASKAERKRRTDRSASSEPCYHYFRMPFISFSHGSARLTMLRYWRSKPMIFCI